MGESKTIDDGGHTAEVGKLATFLDALDEWGCDDNRDRAKHILEFQKSGCDLSEYEDDQRPVWGKSIIADTVVAAKSLKALADNRAGLNIECSHVFKGWREFPDGNGGEAVCKKCGLGAMAYTRENI